MLGMFIPVEFLPGWLQTITRYLPFSYMTWAPARLIVAFLGAVLGSCTGTAFMVNRIICFDNGNVPLWCGRNSGSWGMRRYSGEEFKKYFPVDRPVFQS